MGAKIVHMLKIKENLCCAVFDLITSPSTVLGCMRDLQEHASLASQLLVRVVQPHDADKLQYSTLLLASFLAGLRLQYLLTVSTSPN